MTDTDLDALRFEQALERLEAIASRLEAPDLALEDAIDAYEQGMALARHCLARLDAAQARVTFLALEDE
jgi:exodeoxyribonuclease VII small subunit